MRGPARGPRPGTYYMLTFGMGFAVKAQQVDGESGRAIAHHGIFQIDGAVRDRAQFFVQEKDVGVADAQAKPDTAAQSGSDETITLAVSEFEAVKREVGEKLIQRIKWWEHYTEVNEGEMNNNPSPGNKAGGLTTILEKSLGAVAKGGTTNLQAVYEYAERVDAHGFVYMDTPGYDPVSATGQVAGGANMICFTTGRGSAYGCAPSPSLKIATNTALWQRQEEDMDINCGEIIDGKASIQEMGQRIAGQTERSLTTTVSDIEHIESTSLAGVTVIKVFFQPQVGLAVGEGPISAHYGGRNSVKTVVVSPPGTFRLKGTVLEENSNDRVSGAQVYVTTASGEMLQSGAHRVGICVVGIVDQRRATQVLPRQTHRWRRHRGWSAARSIGRPQPTTAVSSASWSPRSRRRAGPRKAKVSGASWWRACGSVSTTRTRSCPTRRAAGWPCCAWTTRSSC